MRQRRALGRTVTLGTVALGVVLAGCSVGEADPGDVVEPTVEAATTQAEPTPTETPKPQAPDVSTSESPEPDAESDTPAPEPQQASLDQTFAAMLEAIAQDGEDGLTPFLADPEAGDMWRVSDWDWTGGPCAEGGPGESACVGYFEKDGMEMENIFGFDNIDGTWLLVESWVAWE